MENELVCQEYEKERSQLFEACQKSMEARFELQKYEIYQQIIDGIDLLCQKIKKIQETDEGYRIKYYQVSLLRSFMKTDTFVLLISGCNQDYFLDKQKQEVTVDMSNLFEPLAKARQTLYEYVKSKQVKILECQVDFDIMEQAFCVNRYMAKRFRLWLRDLFHTESLLKVQTTEYFFMKWGGHWEKSETILVGDKQHKSQEIFEEIHKESTIDKLDFAKFFHVWDKVNFNDLIVMEKSLPIQSFREAGFSRCVIGLSTLWGSNFKSSCFQRSVFTETNLSKCSFRDAVFDEVHFLNCDLCEADFRGADFKEVSFEGANLKGALFWRKDAAFLHLDNKQIQDITMLAEEVDGCILL